MEEPTILYGDKWSAEIYDYEVMEPYGLPLWQSLAESAEGPALELGCGTGRLLLPLARAGFSVTGLDASPFMLAVARRKLAQEEDEAQQRCRLIEGSMADFSLRDAYGLIFIPARSFQILPGRAEQRGCLESCARHLAPGGRLAIQVFNPMLSKLMAGRVELEPNDFAGPDGHDVRWSAVAEYDLAAQRLRSVWRYEQHTEAGPPVIREYLLEMRYLFRFEVEWMLEACGFEVEALYGDLERSEFTGESPEILVVARQAGSADQ
jgi:SAM-dependent methyltransferase